MGNANQKFAHLKISLEDIVSATNNFADENVIGRGGIGNRYKGKLLWSGELIDIRARRFNKETNDREHLFWMEISMLSTLKHTNLVSLVGFCDENDEKIIIYRSELRGSLSKYLSDPMLLTWTRRLEICVSLAHALSYIHYDNARDFSVIHRSINSAHVLLNEDWEPKLSNFERSMSIKASERHHSFNNGACPCIHGYVDPTILKSPYTVNHKSDMYSFGIVLFELLCGRRSIIHSDSLAPLAVTHYREKRLDEIIDWDLWIQMDSQSFDIFAETAYDCLNEERSQRPNIDEIVTRLEKALEHQNARKSSPKDEYEHLKIPLEFILSATNHFADKNVIGKGGIGKHYMGQLSWSGELIDINAKRFNKDLKDAEQMFWMEIFMLSTLKHKNVVSLVGFCDDVDEKIIVYKREMRGSLSNYLSDPMLLTWVRRLEICVGIAHALSYIHYDELRDFSVIHRVIKSDTILLNDDWKPKLSLFVFSMKIKASQRHRSFHTHRPMYENGYGDPIYIQAKSVNHKSDMYSFGIVLFELLCCRGSIIDNDSDKYLAPLAVTHYREKRLDEIIDWDLWKQMDSQSFDIFTKTAYDCLNEERSQRPNIDEIVTRLEKALEHQNARKSSPKDEYEHLKIPLEFILSATNHFADKNVIGKGGIGNRYSGQLLWLGELIDIRAQRLNKDWEAREQMFWTEISMLSTLKHKNVVSLVGFCDDSDEKIIVHKLEIRGSLSNYLSDPMLLTWVRRLEICVGIAHALSYIHYDELRDFSVIHRVINSDMVLLNDDWKPKLSHFVFSKKIKASQRHRSFHTHRPMYENGYGDPIQAKSVNHKSDMYSFGIVLFELLCCRRSIIDNDSDKYLAPLAITHYREKRLDEIIDWDLWKQMDSQSFDIFTKTAYDCLNEERSQRPNIDEIVTRLEKALEHQNAIMSREFAHVKVPLESIMSATNNFAQENVIGENEFIKTYKGQLLWYGVLININARRLNKEWVGVEQLFSMGIFMLSNLKHKNVVSLVGFCDENDEKIIINRGETRGILRQYLSNSMLLTWVRRLEICVGISHALSYIHYDEPRDFSVILRNLSSSRVLLNDDWKPKLCDFEHSMKIKAFQRHHSFYTNHPKYQKGYGDPTSIETKSVNHKSDMYFFGVVLFELLCGRESTIANSQDNKYLVPVALFHHREKILNDIVDPNLWKQMDPQSFNILVETAHDCLKEERSQRPSIDEIVPRLEKALELQLKRENAINEHSIVAADTSCAHQKGKSLEHLKIGLTDIKLATENFDEKYCIGLGGYGKVYKTQLEHFDSSNWSWIEGVNKCDLPKRRSMVAIKHIFNPEGEQGFITEIETLTSCKHDNIISLLGFCDEGPDHKILIYELASRGSLENYIENDDKMTNLTWVQRINICLNIAHGLKYIHTNTDQDKQKIIHRDIKSANILLGENWEAKIADFGLSQIHPADQEASTLIASTLAGTKGYLDPEYKKHGKLNKKSDIYSFGVVLFEILTGRLAYDRFYTKVNKKGIAPVARRHFENGTLIELIDHKIKEQADGHVFCLSKGPNKDSLDIFSEIAYRCLIETQAQRPTIDDVIHELNKALQAQQKSQKESFKMSLEDIKSATQNFSEDNIIGRGGFRKVYKGVASHTNGLTIIAAKRLDRSLFSHGETGFFRELDIPLKYKHENVIGLVGYCDEDEEKIIVHEFASRGSLDGYLSDSSLTWVLRLKICIDIASGLNFLHTTNVNQEVVIHRDIKSSNVLLFDDWKAKITGFALSLVCPINQDIDYVTKDTAGTIGYSDPLYSTTRSLTKEYDIFSLGAVLFDILCGKPSSIKLNDEYMFLPFLAKNCYQVGKLDELVFEGIKEQIYRQSFDKFARIAYQCLHHRRERRPTALEVVIQLKRALEIQEDHELWDPKLPTNYKNIIQMSKCPEIYSTKMKEELYNTFSKGILLLDDKVLVSFDDNGERNEMVSATMFSYINRCPHKRKSLPESRFETAVEILDISDMNIEIKTRAQFLSPDVVYGVYLVFKLCDLKKCSAKPMYVNLKYRKGQENLHAYFATWRDEHWMMIELHRFLNQNENVVYEFLLENFSSYNRDVAVYVEGIEFRVIDKVKHEGTGISKVVQQVLKSNFDVDRVRQLPVDFKEIFKINKNYEELFWLGNIDRMKLLIVSAKEALQFVSDEHLFTSKSSSHSRFQEVIEVSPRHIFHIKCIIKSQMLSPYTEYACYLVFKLSDKHEGLDCPVKLHDVIHPENNKAEFLYFKTPSPLNIHDTTRVPKEREDGWMEIRLWKFNSNSEFKDDSLSMNMKFTSLEGPMSGLIVCGLEFRPM